ncbi:PaaI family thioesterase [Cupriavidus cauae]|uniref:PaaI family thioesterase n=1 Tax=Cupriavidus cauae TaxID=2608999 RepID=UPI0022439ABF|nr:PaaI family thioesterase [Cupriavidus cauae]UZN48482.1 PaaI family thioesterase [Cupriavidus cauae]
MMSSLTPLSATGTYAEVAPRVRAMVEEILIGSPVARTLGVALDVLAPEHVELVLPFSPGNVTVGKTVHGGVIATLIDIAGAAAASGADPDKVRGGATSALSIQYVAPAEAAALRAVATVVRRGQRQIATEITVYAEQPEAGTVVAKALMNSVLFG